MRHDGVMKLDSRQLAWGLAGGLLYLLFVALTTDMIDNPVFGREIPPTWWSWPSLIVTSVLVGWLTATYIRPKRPSRAAMVSAGMFPDARAAVSLDLSDDGAEPAQKRGLVGAALTYFAVGCPVCNKLVLLVLGWNGAITWFEPFQPVLQLGAIALLIWAIATRVKYKDSCPSSLLPRRAATVA